MSHPHYSQRNSVLGEDCQQCGPMLPTRTDFGGTYLLQEEGQRARLPNFEADQYDRPNTRARRGFKFFAVRDYSFGLALLEFS